MNQDSTGSALRIATAVAALALVALANFVPLETNDFWLQAKVGQLIVEEGRIPRTLLFPFTWAADYRFNVHEALPSVVFYLLEHHLGYDRLLFVKGALGLLMFGLLVAAAWRQSGRPDVGLALAVAGMACMNYRFVMRPELFALFLLAGVLYLCLRVRDGAPARWLAWALPLQLAWASSHGSFILGPGVAALFAAGEGFDAWRRDGRAAALRASRPFALLAAALLAVSIVNPLGVDLLAFPFELSSSKVTGAFIYEWQPTFFSPRFREEPGFWLVCASGAATLALAAWRWRALRSTDVLLLAVFVAMAALRVRHGVWLGVVVPLIGAGLLRRPATAPDGPAAPERRLLAGVLATCAAGLAWVLNFGNAYYAFPYATPSFNLTEPMRELVASPQMQGRVFTSMELGAELIYRAWPRLKPSIDSRIDSYGDDYYLMHVGMIREEARLLPFLDEYDVRYMLLSRRDFDEHVRHHQALLARGWRVQFLDHKMVLLRLP